ncbi:MAG: bifunctional precorrin-2 dehydrogenase/sirohydrochlorin ferrochelatase [Sedimentisphaerales bacterium]|nr:bifunctional precorrin-2 dehydrogenase/sirohydrochlorin ferrochelatase [Sedimentisphaerales bacterium]
MKSRLYPIFCDLAGRKVLVVGGGQVAERKVESLLASRAKVVVVSPELTEELGILEAEGKIEVCRRKYEDGDITGKWLVVAACGDGQVNRQVFEQATEQGIFCNVVDEPTLCSFQVPAVVRRGLMQIAVSTGGVSPALSKKIRLELENHFGVEFEGFLEGLGELREHVKGKYPDAQPKRAEILQDFANSEAFELLKLGKLNEYKQLLDEFKDR